jgi:F-type H+-transporting ATPase subunit gamma
MTQLKEIRSRIASVKNTRQVTSAMKMVSAVKLKKAQDIIIQMALYDSKTYEILSHLMLGKSKWFQRLLEAGTPERVMVVVVGSNRGLCGAFNANVAKMAIQHAIASYPEQIQEGNLKFFVVGKQVEKELVREGPKLLNRHIIWPNNHQNKPPFA